MIDQSGKRPEVFIPAAPLAFKNTRTVYPPIPDADGRFWLSEIMDWFDLMDDVHGVFGRICEFFRRELKSMTPQDQQRAKARLSEIESILSIFTCRHPSLIPVQQRCKDLCAMISAELMVCTGDVDCIQTLSRYIAGSAEKWVAFSRALVENQLVGHQDWRQAKSPAIWVKMTTNHIAAKEFWVSYYAVSPAESRGTVPLEEGREASDEAVIDWNYTNRSLAVLEAAAKDDSEVAEYLGAKTRYPGWHSGAIWMQLGWEPERGKRVDRRFRRMRDRLRDLGGGIQCREYRPLPSLSDASCTTYFEALWNGVQGSKKGVWQHRDPYRDEG